MNNYAVLYRMAKLMRSLMRIELKAIIHGALGHLSAIAFGMFAVASLLQWIHNPVGVFWKIWLICAIITAIVRGFFAFYEQLFNHDMAFTLLRDIRNTVFSAMQKLAPAILQQSNRGNLVTVITEDIELLEIFYAHTMSPIAIAVITSVVCSFAFGLFNIWLGIIALVSYSIVGIVLPMMIARFASPIAYEERQLQGQYQSMVLERLDALRELHNFQAEQYTIDTLTGLAQQRRNVQHRNWRVQTINTIITLTIILACMLTFTLVAWHTLQGSDIAFVPIVGFLASFAPTVALARLGSSLQPTVAAARRVFAVLDMKPVVEEIADDEGQTLVGAGSMSAHHLAFSYENSAEGTDVQRKQVLRDINCALQPRDIAVLTGSNGAGKTTLLQLLMRFRERTGGDLRINDIPINRIATRNLRETVTLVSQDVYIFSDTIANNIAIANPEATEADIVQVIHQACLDEVVAQFPEGIHHTLVRNGMELSEGQKQRIAVARALLSKASLILLDEPTNNMDALLEGKVLRALQECQNNAAYCIVSHRSTIRAIATKHWHLQDGVITETDNMLHA